MVAESCVPDLELSVRRYRKIRRGRGLKPRPYVGSLSPTPPLSSAVVDEYLRNHRTLVMFTFLVMPEHSGLSQVELTVNEVPISLNIKGQVVPVEDDVVLISAVSTEIFMRYAVLRTCPGRVNLVVLRLAKQYKRTKDLSFVPDMTRVVDSVAERSMIR